eukprot:gene12222-8746_t
MDILVKGYASQDVPDRTKRLGSHNQRTSDDGHQLRKHFWDFMKKAYNWRCLYATGPVGDTLPVYAPPGVHSSTRTMIKNIEYFETDDFEAHLVENECLLLPWWELWEILSSKGWRVRATEEGDAFEFAPARELVRGVTHFASKVELMQFIARFPYPLQSPGQLAVSLRRHGWQATEERTGVSFLQPATRHKFSYDSLVRHLFENPSLYFSGYFDGRPDVASRVAEALRVKKSDLVLDVETCESFLLSGADNRTCLHLRRTLDALAHDDAACSDSGHPLALALRDLLVAFGWKIGVIDRDEDAADAVDAAEPADAGAEEARWWDWMTVYRPPYAVYGRTRGVARPPLNASPGTVDRFFSQIALFGRDYFFDLAHVVALLRADVDFVYATRPSLAAVEAVTQLGFVDYSGPDGRAALKKELCKRMVNFPVDEGADRLQDDVRHMLQSLGWRVCVDARGRHAFIPPTALTMHVTPQNLRQFQAGAAYYTSLGEVRDYFLVALSAAYSTQTIRSAVSTAHSTPSGSPDAAQEKRSPIGASPMGRPVSSLTIRDERVVVSDRDVFHWQALKRFVAQRFHGEILGCLVKLGWGHYRVGGPGDEAVVYCAPEMTEALTERGVAVAAKLDARHYLNRVRGDDFFFDLTDADALLDKARELVQDDRHLLAHARSRQRYFRQFQPGRAYPGTLSPREDQQDAAMLPRVVSNLLETLERKRPPRVAQAKRVAQPATPATPSSAATMDTTATHQKVSAFFDIAILRGSAGYAVRLVDLMPVLKRIGWGVRYVNDSAVLLAPDVLFGAAPVQYLARSAANARDLYVSPAWFAQQVAAGALVHREHFFFERDDRDEILALVERLVPDEATLLQHMTPEAAARWRRRRDAADGFVDADEPRRLREVLVAKRSPVSPLSDDDDGRHDDGRHDDDAASDAASDAEGDADDDDESLLFDSLRATPERDGLQDDERMVYLQLIEELQREKRAFSAVLPLLRELGWSKLYLGNDATFVCAPGVFEAALAAGLVSERGYVKREFLTQFRREADYFDEMWDKAALFAFVEARELALCLASDVRKFSHIKLVLQDLGWLLAYVGHDACYLLPPAVVAEAERRQWLRREKKCVYASRDLERAYALREPKALFNEVLDKDELYAHLDAELRRYSAARPAAATAKAAGVTPAAAAAADAEPSTFQQKFRARDLAPPSADTVAASAASAPATAASDRSGYFRSDASVDAADAVDARAAFERDTWALLRDELATPQPRYGTVAALLKSLRWLALYVDQTSCLCAPSMLQRAAEVDPLHMRRRALRAEATRLFARGVDYFVEGEDAAALYATLRARIAALQPPLPPKAAASVAAAAPRTKPKPKPTTAAAAAEAQPSTTRALKAAIRRMGLQSGGSAAPPSSAGSSSAAASAAVSSGGGGGSKQRQRAAKAAAESPAAASVASSPASQTSPASLSELPTVELLRRALAEKPTRFSVVFGCLRELGWAKKWLKSSAFLFTPPALAALQADGLVSGVYVDRRALSACAPRRDYFDEALEKEELFDFLRALAAADFACPEPTLRMATRSPDPAEAVGRLAVDDAAAQLSPRLATVAKRAPRSPRGAAQRQRPRKLFADDDDDADDAAEPPRAAPQPPAPAARDDDEALDLDADDADASLCPASQVQRDEALPVNFDVASDWAAVFDAPPAAPPAAPQFSVERWPEQRDAGLRALLAQGAPTERLYVHLRDLHRWHRQFMRKAAGVRFVLSADYVTFRAGRHFGQPALVEDDDYFVDDEALRRVLCAVCGVAPVAPPAEAPGRLSRRASLTAPPPQPQPQRSGRSHRGAKRRVDEGDAGGDSDDDSAAERKRRRTEPAPPQRQLSLDEEMALLCDDADDDAAAAADASDALAPDGDADGDGDGDGDAAPVAEDEATWSLERYVRVARRRLIAQSGGDIAAFPVPQREEESLAIFDAMRKCLAAGSGGVVHVVGAPGTGKTLTVHSTARRVMALLRAAELDHCVAFASTMGGIEDTADVLFSVAEQTGLAFPAACVTKAERVAFVSERLRRPALAVSVSDDDATLRDAASTVSGHTASTASSARRGAVPLTVLLVDELTDFRAATLRDLLALALHQPASSLLIVATGNAHLLNDVSLVRPALSRGAFKQIVFAAYDRDRLLGILRARAGRLFDERAAVFLAAKVIKNENADPRKLLERCEQAVDSAVQQQLRAGKDLAALPVAAIVTVPVVMAMFGQADAARLAKFDSLAPYQRTILIGLLLAGFELRGVDTRPFSVQEAHDAYHNYLAELRIDDEVSLDSIAHYLQEICSYSFVAVHRDSVRRHQVGAFGHGAAGAQQRFVMQISVETLLKSQTLAPELERKYLLRFQQQKQAQAVRDLQLHL